MARPVDMPKSTRTTGRISFQWKYKEAREDPMDSFISICQSRDDGYVNEPEFRVDAVHVSPVYSPRPVETPEPKARPAPGSAVRTPTHLVSDLTRSHDSVMDERNAELEMTDPGAACLLDLMPRVQVKLRSPTNQQHYQRYFQFQHKSGRMTWSGRVTHNVYARLVCQSSLLALQAAQGGRGVIAKSADERVGRWDIYLYHYEENQQKNLIGHYRSTTGIVGKWVTDGGDGDEIDIGIKFMNSKKIQKSLTKCMTKDLKKFLNVQAKELTQM